jgi:ubiquinone/menaquinone biosynthesis C-methylase UbiE
MDVAGAYDEIARIYDDEYEDAKSLAENNILRRILKVGGFTKDRVLDLGCGTGLLMDLAPVSSDRYVGVDPSSGMLEVARSKYPEHTFVQSSAEHMQHLEDESFDNIVSLFGPINYAQSPDDITYETWRLLRSGGQFLHMIYSESRSGKNYILDGIDHYHKFYTRAEAMSLFGVSGEFKDVKIFGFTGILEKFRGISPRLEMLATLLGWVEICTVGVANPDLFQYLMVTGVKV